MKILLAIFSLWTVAASAQELPTNLVLSCEGRETSSMSGMSLPHEQKFKSQLKIQEGDLVDINAPWMTVKNCKLADGVVRCESQRVVNELAIGGSELRKLKASIVRATGEFRLFLRTFDYERKKLTGKKIGGVKLLRIGMCRVVSKPIF
jgi:hypothetical protein